MFGFWNWRNNGHLSFYTLTRLAQPVFWRSLGISTQEMSENQPCKNQFLHVFAGSYSVLVANAPGLQW